VPPFTVQYLCPSQSPNWQGGKVFQDFNQAVLMAQILRPQSQLGRARVLDALMRVVYEC
jgi:hypothetical protein